MTYLPYIVAAYAVFAVILAWDGLTPWLKQRRLLRSIRLRAMRENSPFQTRRNRDRPAP